MNQTNVQSNQPFQIEQRAGCILVYGTAPVHVLSDIASKADKRAVACPLLAQLAECTLAVGLDEDVKKLSDRLNRINMVSTAEAYADLNQNAISWLAVGKHDIRTKFMFYTLSGVKPDDTNFAGKPFPHDASEFKQCKLLLVDVPEFALKLGKMAGVSDVWKALVENWELMSESLQLESPDWMNNRDSVDAPQTDRLVRDITNKSKVIQFQKKLGNS